MNDDELDELFQSLPREIAPHESTWPSVAERIRARHSPWSRSAAAIAAALLLFVAGIAAGRATSRGGNEASAGRAVPTEARANDSFFAAIRVQETATAYIGALAALPRFDPDSRQPSSASEQGREVARVTLGIAQRAAAGL